MQRNDSNTITIFNHTIQQDPLNQITQTDNDTVYITPRFDIEGLIELKVGVLLPFSQTSDKLTESIVWGGSSAIRMAINEINAAQLVPGAYITLIKKDSFPEASVDQGAITNAVYALVTLLQQGVIGVIGDVTSSWTALSALMTSALELPQCSFAASAISFSDKAQFKYFFRTIPTDVVMMDAMLQFVVQEGWTKVGVLYSDDPLGQQLYQRAIQQSEALNIQLINYQSFPSKTTSTSAAEMKNSLDTLAYSGARIFLVAAQGQTQANLLVQAAVSGYLSPDYVWLLVGDGMMTDLNEAVNNYNKNLITTNNAMTSEALTMDTDFNGLIHFVNWLTLDGYQPYDKFTSKWSQLDRNVYPYAGTNDTRTNEGLAYSCMMMMADGFQHILKQEVTNHTNGLIKLASGNLSSSMTPQAFNSGYVGPEGPMLLDSNGDVMSGNYRIMNYQHGVSVPIGQSVVGNLSITSPPMFFDGTYIVPSDSPPSIALNPDRTSAISYVIIIMSAIGSIFALSVLLLVIVYRKNEIFKAASPLFCVLELIGFLLTYIAVVMMIGIPSQATCIVMPLAFNIGFLLVISNMVAKKYRIYRIFNNVLISGMAITDLQLIKSVTVMMGFDMIILIVAIIVIRPMPEKVDVSLTQHYWTCNMDHPSKNVFSGLMYGYCIALLLFGTFLAYKTRLAGRRYYRYSECRQMGLSIYNIFFTFIIGIAVVMNPMADFYTKYYISVIIVLWSATFSLLILFLPKVVAFVQQYRHQQRQHYHDKENDDLATITTSGAPEASYDGSSNNLTPQHSRCRQSSRKLSHGSNTIKQQQHLLDSHHNNTMELLSLDEMLGTKKHGLPSFFLNDDHHGSGSTGDQVTVANDDDEIHFLQPLGQKHDAFVQVYEADVPARKVLRYFPYLSQWQMLHIMVFPRLGYFTYISETTKQGRVMAYDHATIETTELENYVLKIQGLYIYDMYIQVPNLEALKLWEKRLNRRQQQTVDSTDAELSFLTTPNALAMGD